MTENGPNMRFWPDVAQIVASHNPKVADSNPAPATHQSLAHAGLFCAMRLGRPTAPSRSEAVWRPCGAVLDHAGDHAGIRDERPCSLTTRGHNLHLVKVISIAHAHRRAGYWPAYLEAMRTPPSGGAPFSQAEIDEMVRFHGLPDNWPNLKYDDFLTRRRRKIAAVIREAFERLEHGDPDDAAATWPPSQGDFFISSPPAKPAESR
jgi:hypothetical protein